MRKCKLQKFVSVLLATLLVIPALAGCGNNATESAVTEETGITEETSITETSSDGDTVIIGFVWPLTGGSATIGQQHNDGALMAIEEINANGGIKSMGGAKIEAIVADSETKPDIGASQTERLIVNGNASMIVGAYNSAVSFPASEVAQRYETPWINMGAVKNEITELGYEWVFRVNNKATYDTEEMIKAVELLSEETGEEVKTYALIYESTDWGSDNAKTWKQFADERGWECVVDEPVTAGQSDMSAQVLKIKNANPDLINSSFYTSDAILFAETLAANKVNPKFGHWSVGGGNQEPAFFDAVDPTVYEYLFVQEDWDVGGVERYDWIKEVSEKVQAEKGYALNSFFAQGWTAAYVAYEALEAAGSADKTAIKEALKNMDISRDDEGQRVLMTGYPRIKFDENGQNTFSSGTIVQYQNGTPIPLSPEENRLPGSVGIIPIPDDWDTRGK